MKTEMLLYYSHLPNSALNIEIYFNEQCSVKELFTITKEEDFEKGKIFSDFTISHFS